MDRPIEKKPERSRRDGQVRRARAAASTAASMARQHNPLSAAILEEAHRSGLLEGGKSAHVSFRVPQALVEAAKRETGITPSSELGTLALAMLAQPGLHEADTRPAGQRSQA